jgi:hypothetical protein
MPTAGVIAGVIIGAFFPLIFWGACLFYALVVYYIREGVQPSDYTPAIVTVLFGMLLGAWGLFVIIAVLAWIAYRVLKSILRGGRVGF